MSVGRFSVVIPNYNYGRFVGEAIDSALALNWPDVEVIVSDDGSTDGSLDVIRQFGDRIAVITGRNAGQRSAVNRGLAHVTGDVVIVLDSDDLLPADLPRLVQEVWGPAVSKVQFRMQRVDETGRAFGDLFPRFEPVPSPEQVRRWFETTSAYPTPPGSGNAYARWFIDLLAPLDSRTGDASDSALLAAAPVLGDVVTAPDVVVGYRQHGSNDSDLLANSARFAREIRRAEARWSYASDLAPSRRMSNRALFRSRELLQLRVCQRRVRRGDVPALTGDSAARQFTDAVMSPVHPGPETIRLRLAIAVWCLLVLLAPSPVARRLIAMRYQRKQ